jgi:hypothetical protein
MERGNPRYGAIKLSENFFELAPLHFVGRGSDLVAGRGYLRLADSLIIYAPISFFWIWLVPS